MAEEEYAPSASTALFQESTQSLAQRLREVGSPEALAMAREADALSSAFERWKTVRPADDDRVAKIQQLFNLNRKAMEFLAASRAVSSSR